MILAACLLFFPAAVAIAAPPPAVALREVASGFAAPTAIVNAGDGSGRLFILEQDGLVWILRNGARLAFRYRLPSDLKALVTSSEDHIAYSVGEEFRTRCVSELGYFPMEFITRVSPVEAEFKPSIASLFFDSNDPLDP